MGRAVLPRDRSRWSRAQLCLAAAMRTGTVNVSILRGGVMEHPGGIICEDGDGMIVLRGDLEPVECHFCLWQFSALPTVTANVRFGGKTDMAIALQMSAFDPKR